MTLAAAALDRPIGEQSPRIRLVPEAVSSSGVEVVELAASAGLQLDPWQQLVLTDALGEDASGKWAAFEVGLVVSRQNGKGSILEARELAGLFLFGEQLQVHTAHEFKTAQEAFRRILTLVENTDDFRKRVKRVRTSHGEEGIELLSGQRLRFLARSSGSGRGFTGDVVYLDEAMFVTDDHMAALLPTLSAIENPQVWYTGSAGGQHSIQLGRVRRRGIAGEDPGLAYLEWSIDPHTGDCPVDCGEHDDPDDPRSHARANPAYGGRITHAYVGNEMRTLGRAAFASERLGVGDWPVEEDVEDAWLVIREEAWSAVADVGSMIEGELAIAPDISPDRSMGAIAVAGWRADGLPHIEVVEHRHNTGWMVDRIAELAEKWSPSATLIDGRGPAATLIRPLEERGIEVTVMNTKDVTEGAQGLFDRVAEKTVRHRGQAQLADALAIAKQRTVGDGAWAWGRKDVGDITPLVAVTNALWGLTAQIATGPMIY